MDPRRWSPLIALLLLCSPSTAGAQPDSPPPAEARPADGLPAIDELIGRVSRALNPPRASSRDIEIVTEIPDSPPVKWQGRQLRKAIDGGRRNLTVLESPPSVSGFSVLVAESAKDDTRWMYVPPVRRVRQIVYPGRYEYFLGTDLTSSDFGFLRFDPSARVRAEERLDGRNTWRIEEEPAPTPGGYSRILTWISTENDLPVRREYYDEAKSLWKVETWTNVQTIEGIPTALELTTEHVEERSRTSLRFRDVDYDVNLDDRQFDPTTMASASSSASADGVATPRP